jgi:hypothetical protein
VIGEDAFFNSHFKQLAALTVHHLVPAVYKSREFVAAHAYRCLPVFLYMHRLRREAAAEAGRLLRVLFLWLDSVPAGSGRASGRDGRRFLLCRIAIMANDTVQTSRDWLRSPRTNALAWWIPKAAIVAGLFFPPPARTATWIIALVWMGTACILMQDCVDGPTAVTRGLIIWR